MRGPDPRAGPQTERGRWRGRFRWKHWYRLKSYARFSLWLVPFISIPLALLATRIVHYADAWIGWSFLDLAVPGARAMLETVITATLSFSVFTFGSLLVALQVASGQLTPRVIATTLLRDIVVKYAVGLFIFTLLFALSVLDRMDSAANQTAVFVAGLLGLASFVTFLYLIDYAARLLRPISILARVGSDGIAVIDSVYPAPSLGPLAAGGGRVVVGPVARVVRHGGISQIVTAVNLPTLVVEAERCDGIIELVPQVGDFVATDEPLFRLQGGAAVIDDEVLRGTVAFGSERTMEQDPTFAFRIVVDIALRALSPAIADPTTAVIAIDQLHRLLRRVGQRHLMGDETRGPSGKVRVIVRTPNWEDFVHLSLREIRGLGGDNLQVVRRLRAMLVNLMQTLPSHRGPALELELAVLDRDIDRHFVHPEDRVLARVADVQGLGGHSGAGLDDAAGTQPS
jgi:uncharacterized membrane protein